MEEVLYGELLLLLAGDVQDDPAGAHHQQAVAVADGVLHIMGDHQGGKVVLCHDLVGEGEHLGGGLGVESRGVLVQQQELGPLQGGHQKGQRLTLAAGEEAHLGGEPVLKAQIQGLEQLPILLPLLLGNAPPETPGLAPAGGESQVLLDLHGGGGSLHGVLEDPADEGRPLEFRQAGNILPADGNAAAVHGKSPGDGVEQGGFARAVAADNGDEVPLVEMEGEVVQSRPGVDGTRVEGLGDVFQIKHGCCLPSRRRAPPSHG